MKTASRSNSISIITVVKDDDARFLRTLNSVVEHLPGIDGAELVVVDSSAAPLRDLVRGMMGILPYKYIYTKPSGVYSAMNTACEHASGGYLLFLNAGDVLLPSMRLWSLCSVENRPVKVYRPVDVCALFAMSSPIRLLADQKKFPHQSTVYLKSLHKDYGCYANGIDSDQLFLQSLPSHYVEHIDLPISARFLSHFDVTYLKWLQSTRLPRFTAALCHLPYILFRALKNGLKFSSLSAYPGLAKYRASDI